MSLEYDEVNPSWLIPLLKAHFFVECSIHGGATRNECNMFCLDFIGDPRCTYCMIDHEGHHTVQIRRSSYQNVIRVSELQNHIDISYVQTYIINSAKIVFLKERPQSRPVKGAINTCEICYRSIVESFRFCSLACKLEGVQIDPKLSFELFRGSRLISPEPDSFATNPKKLQKVSIFGYSIDTSIPNSTDEEEGSSKSFTEREKFDLNVALEPVPVTTYRREDRKRKGIPRRSPLQ